MSIATAGWTLILIHSLYIDDRFQGGQVVLSLCISSTITSRMPADQIQFAASMENAISCIDNVLHCKTLGIYSHTAGLQIDRILANANRPHEPG